MQRVALISVASALVMSTVSAQQVPGRLTLAEALALAQENNPQYRQALNSRNASGADARAGWAGLLPRVSASMGFGASSSRVVTGQDDFGEPIALPAPREFRGSSAFQSVSAGLTLFDGLASFHNLRAARAAADASAAQAHLTWGSVQAETARRFYTALVAGQHVGLEERLLAAAQEQLANTEQRFALAAANLEDVLGARVDVARQELAVARARGEARKAQLALREQIGIGEDLTFELVGDLPQPVDLATLDAPALVASALASHPRIAELEAAAQAAAASASAASGRRWPTISASAGFGRSVGLSSYNALFELNPRNRSLSFNLSLSLPLFTGFQTSAAIAGADAHARNAEEDLRAGRLAVEREVRTAVIDLQNAHGALEVARRAAELSRQRADLARQRYQTGQLPFTNLQQIITAAEQAERALVDAQLGLAVAAVTLEERVGTEMRR